MILALSAQARVHLLSVLTDAHERLVWRTQPLREDKAIHPSVLAYLDDVMTAVDDTREQLRSCVNSTE